jgi:hypothetical protein
MEAHVRRICMRSTVVALTIWSKGNLLMKNRNLLFLLIPALICLFCGSAFADSVEVQGSTSGSFWNQAGTVNYGNAIGDGDPWTGEEDDDLLFEGASFGPTFGPVLTLGAFRLERAEALAPDNYDPFQFRLRVQFDVPVGSNEGNATGEMTGFVNWALGGGVNINFGAPVTISYSNTTGSGSFDLSLSNVSLSVGSALGRHAVDTEPLRGTISNATFAAVPETSAIVLFGTLLGGVAFVMRKRLARDDS